MNTLFVAHTSGFYGANKSLLTLMILLRERHGINPVVLLPNKGQMCVVLNEAGIPYKVFHYYWWVNNNHGFFQWLLNKRKQLVNLKRLKKICKLYEEENIDLIYTNSICVNVGYLMAKRMGVPHIWQARESLVQFSLSLSLSLSLSIWSSVVNKKYILISDYMMEYYKRYLPNDRMVKVYNGVDLPKDVCDRSKNNICGRLQIGCMGILSEQKNQLELLRAQALLHKEGVDVETWLIGSAKADYTPILQDFIKTNDLHQIAHIVGHQNDVFPILQQMNLGVVSAHDEAFGRVTVEFMLMRMPVVVSHSGANAELVESGVTGEVYELGDVEALAQAIKMYVKKPELLEEQGARAEQKAKEEFSAERNADLIFEQINQVITK